VNSIGLEVIYLLCLVVIIIVVYFVSSLFFHSFWVCCISFIGWVVSGDFSL